MFVTCSYIFVLAVFGTLCSHPQVAQESFHIYTFWALQVLLSIIFLCTQISVTDCSKWRSFICIHKDDIASGCFRKKFFFHNISWVILPGSLRIEEMASWQCWCWSCCINQNYLWRYFSPALVFICNHFLKFFCFYT